MAEQKKTLAFFLNAVKFVLCCVVNNVYVMTFFDNRLLCKIIGAELIIIDNYRLFDHFKYYLNISKQLTRLLMVCQGILYVIIHDNQIEMTVIHNERTFLLTNSSFCIMIIKRCELFIMNT